MNDYIKIYNNMTFQHFIYKKIHSPSIILFLRDKDNT